MDTPNVKQEARELVDALPEDASWEDLIYRIYVRQAIEAGLEDSEEDRTTEISKVRARFGLKP